MLRKHYTLGWNGSQLWGESRFFLVVVLFFWLRLHMKKAWPILLMLIIMVAVGNLVCAKWNRGYKVIICQFDRWATDDSLAGPSALWLGWRLLGLIAKLSPSRKWTAPAVTKSKARLPKKKRKRKGEKNLAHK